MDRDSKHDYTPSSGAPATRRGLDGEVLALEPQASRSADSPGSGLPHPPPGDSTTTLHDAGPVAGRPGRLEVPSLAAPAASSPSHPPNPNG
jgi:hypothetical protein